MSALRIMELGRRHIQNMSEATSVTHHWGYADRAVPCTNDPGSCQYLDVVYHSHDLGMLYTGIIWATILGILFLWAIYSYSKYGSGNAMIEASGMEDSSPPQSCLTRIQASVATYTRQYLLPDCIRPVFGRTTRLQVLVLVTLTGYLTVFTFVGIVYSKWVTPVKKMPGTYNTRTSLGPFADRVGVLAYALTPLSVLLSSRESLLSLITGLPYQSFNFLHRWLGYIIVAQSLLHTIGWCVVELRLYQPQPSVGLEWIQQLYMIWGVIAVFFLMALFVLSTPWAIKRTGYEFFRKSHYILAMIYIGACIGHWAQLSAFLIPALVVWFIDRAIRLVRTALLHYNYVDGGSVLRFRSTEAGVTHFPDSVNGDIVRLDFNHSQEPWKIGQHFYLCFPKLSLWQSHPFTPLSLPKTRSGMSRHSYIFRAKSGMTKKLAEFAATSSSRTTVSSEKSISTPSPTCSVVLNGPYGVDETEGLTPSTNILCVAGGTGITYVLPVLLSKVQNCGCSSGRKLQLIWAIRQKSDMAWINSELDTLYEASKAMSLKISIFVTREDDKASNQSISSVDKTNAVNVMEKSVASSLSSGTGTEVPGTCCGHNQTSDKEIEVCSPPNPREPSITIERRGSLTTAPPEMRHPDLYALVHDFVDSTVRGPTVVYASGPGGMISDLRSVIAGCNDGGRVWKGDMRGSVDLRCDDRLEW